MYGEPFSVPEPLETIFVSWFQGGEVFRSGLTYRKGAGNVFYFRPGHETYPTYHDETVGLVLRNAVNWAYNPNRYPELNTAPNTPVEQAIEPITARGGSLHEAGEEGTARAAVSNIRSINAGTALQRAAHSCEGLDQCVF
eukprot:gene28553-34702_t